MAPLLTQMAMWFWLLLNALDTCGQTDRHQMAGGAVDAVQSDCAAAACCASDAQHHMSTERESTTAHTCVLPLTSVQRARAPAAGHALRSRAAWSHHALADTIQD